MTRRDVPGTVYLLHFDEPIGNTDSKTGYARHYTGWASDLAARLAEHRSRSDVKIMQAVRKAGIGWELARTWPGTRKRERQIQVQGSAARVCPVCKGQPAQRQPVTIEAACRVPALCRGAEAAAEPAPLWESVISHLGPAEAAALLGELADAERAAWDAATPDAGAEYGPRFDVACELSRLRGYEASAAERLAEARAIALAEGWAGEPAPAGRETADRPFDHQAAGRPELPCAEGARVKEEDMFGDAARERAAAEAAEGQAAHLALADAMEMHHPADRIPAVAAARERLAAVNAADRERATGSFAALLDRDCEAGA